MYNRPSQLPVGKTELCDFTNFSAILSKIKEMTHKVRYTSIDFKIGKMYLSSHLHSLVTSNKVLFLQNCRYSRISTDL